MGGWGVQKEEKCVLLLLRSASALCRDGTRDLEKYNIGDNEAV